LRFLGAVKWVYACVLQAGFAGPQRRTSFVGILHQMSAQNRLLYTPAEEARRLSTGDVTADSPTTDDDPGSETARPRVGDGAAWSRS